MHGTIKCHNIYSADGTIGFNTEITLDSIQCMGFSISNNNAGCLIPLQLFDNTNIVVENILFEY